MSSFLDKVYDEKEKKYKERGMYDPRKRYGFKNLIIENHPIAEKLVYNKNADFTFSWNGNPITVKPGVEIELPEHMAILATHKQVDEIMQTIAKLDTDRLRLETRNAYAASPLGGAAGIPHARKVWEDKIIRELKVDEQSPEIQVIRAQMKEQVLADINNSQKPPEPIEAAVAGLVSSGNSTAPAEFSEIPSR